MKESDWMWNQLNNLQNQHRSTVGLSVFLLYSLNLSENEISWTFHSINCDTDWRRTVMLIGTDNGVQGDHDSVLSILAEVLAGRVLLHHGEEAESCGVCSYVLLDSIFCYLLMLSSIFHVSCTHSDSDEPVTVTCGRYFLQQQIWAQVKKKINQKLVTTNMLESARKKWKVANMCDRVFVPVPLVNRSQRESMYTHTREKGGKSDFTYQVSWWSFYKFTSTVQSSILILASEADFCIKEI